ncbi:hypothetical protein D9Q98_002154 [Chlorella vulgaris]|uniref:Uncharacterized protein n=1 Tax=Chlorella vulgaris TaxID=3077 RepID=A0A9D4Z0G4_CHLVU|nr:hypothetical protein D9Q98_002154 [Chlorella vulgaris]
MQLPPGQPPAAPAQIQACGQPLDATQALAPANAPPPLPPQPPAAPDPVPATLLLWPFSPSLSNMNSSGLTSPDLRSMLASPAGTVRGSGRTSTVAAARSSQVAGFALTPAPRKGGQAPGSDSIVLSSPTRSLPAGVQSLLASPDFRCVFAPSGTAAATDAAQSPASASAAAAAGLHSQQLPQLPLAARPAVKSSAATARPSWPLALSQVQPLALPAQLQPRFSWALLPSSEGDEAVPGASLPATDPGDTPTVPPHHLHPSAGRSPFAAPTPLARLVPQASPVPAAAAVAAASRKPRGRGGGILDRQSGAGQAQGRGRRAAASSAAAAVQGGSKGVVPAGAEQAEDGLPTFSQPSPHRFQGEGLGCSADSPAGTSAPARLEQGLSLGLSFGLDPQQALLLAPLLTLSPQGTPLPPTRPSLESGADSHGKRHAPLAAPAPSAGPAGTVCVAQQLVQLQAAAQDPAAGRRTKRQAALAARKAAEADAEAAETAARGRRQAGSGVSTAPTAAASRPAKKRGRSAASQARADTAAKAARVAGSTGAAAAAMAAPSQPRRRHGRKSAAPRKAAAEGHTVTALDSGLEGAAGPQIAVQAAATGARRAAKGSKAAGRRLDAPTKPAAAAGKRRAATAAEAAGKKRRLGGGSAAGPSKQGGGEQQAEMQQQQQGQQGQHAPLPIAVAAGPGGSTAGRAAEAAVTVPVVGSGGMLRRAAAVAADAGIRACAAVEGKRTAQATKQPLLQQQLAGSATEAHSEGAEQGEEEGGGGGGSKGRQQRQRKVQPRGSRGMEGRRKDPVKVAAALLSRQRVPGQLTRIQRFGFQIQVHVGDRVGEAGVVVGQQGRDKMAEASGAITGTGQGGVERVMVKVKAAHRLHGKGPDVREGEIRQQFGNNPDVSKALRLLADQGKLVRNGLGGRQTPFTYSSTAKGRDSVPAASSKLADDVALIARGKEAAAAQGGEQREQGEQEQQQEQQQEQPEQRQEQEGTEQQEEQQQEQEETKQQEEQLQAASAGAAAETK